MLLKQFEDSAREITLEDAKKINKEYKDLKVGEKIYTRNYHK